MPWKFFYSSTRPSTSWEPFHKQANEDINTALSQDPPPDYLTLRLYHEKDDKLWTHSTVDFKRLLQLQVNGKSRRMKGLWDGDAAREFSWDVLVQAYYEQRAADLLQQTCCCHPAADVRC